MLVVAEQRRYERVERLYKFRYCSLVDPFSNDPFYTVRSPFRFGLPIPSENGRMYD